VTFRNCENDATLVALGETASGFILNPYSNNTKEKSMITIEDSIFMGNMYNVSANDMNNKYICGIHSHYPMTYSYSESFLETYGSKLSTLVDLDVVGEEGYILVGNSVNKPDFYKGYRDVIARSTGSLTDMNFGDAFVVNKVENAVDAIITLEIAPNDTNDKGAYLGTYLTEKVKWEDYTSGTYTTQTVKYFTITINAEDGSAQHGVVGSNFNVQHEGYGHTHNGASVKVVQHDAAGVAVSVITSKIA